MAKQKVSPMDYNAHKPKGKLEAVKVSGASIVAAIDVNPVYQPLDSDLTAIAALATTTFGRSLLTSANAAALLTLVGAQPLDSDLTAIAALTTTAYGRSVLATADAAALRTLAGTVIGTNVQAYDADLAAIAGLTSAADKGIQFTGSGTAAVFDLTTAGKALLDDASASAQRTTLGLGTLAVASTITTGDITADAVTYAKIQNVSATDRLLGRDTAAAGDIEELTATGGIEFTGTGIQTSAFTGDVTKTAGGTALTIANDAVTFAKMQNSSAASRILGRGSTSGAGDFEELTISTGLTLTGTVLTASGGSYGSVAAWCVFNGTGTIALVQNSSNVSSLTDNGIGDYTVNFSPSLTDANYAMSGSGSGDAYKDFIAIKAASEGAAATTKTAAACRIICGRSEGTTTDGTVISVIFIR